MSIDDDTTTTTTTDESSIIQEISTTIPEISTTIPEISATTPEVFATTDDSSTIPEKPTTPSRPHITWSDSYTKAQMAIDSLSSILPSIPSSLSASETPAFSLLHEAEIATQISTLLRQPDSGAGDNSLCRWLYDTFQSAEPELHLVVLRFLPIIAGNYLSRVTLHKPLAGFEAVLLALYAHETGTRNGQPVTVSVPDLSHSSIYHETKQSPKSNATELNIAVISPSLEPHGTVRSTRRARIVGVALELYYNKISQMPIKSKIEFCEFCQKWSGENGDICKEIDEITQTGPENEELENVEKVEKVEKGKEGRILLPWEILQPILRILSHCLMGPKKEEELFEAAWSACRCLYARSLHDINPKAILVTGSLLKLAHISSKSGEDDVDHTEIEQTNVITL